MNYKYKIGQEIEFTNDSYIETTKGKKVKILKGDRAMIVKKIDDNTGEVVYTTGEARGLSNKIKIEIDNNLDADEIAKKILNEI